MAVALMVMSMIVAVIVPVIVAMMMVGMMAMQVRLSARQSRVLAEHQGFDGHRYGHRRQADTPEIDVVEIPQHDAVDAEDLALHLELLAQHRAERLRHVAVEHDVERLLSRDRVRQAADDALRERKDALVRR